jgi:hypothetical protein
MLVGLKFKEIPAWMDAIETHVAGLYTGWNESYVFLDNPTSDESYPYIHKVTGEPLVLREAFHNGQLNEVLEPYGVADSVEQVLRYLEVGLLHPDRRYAVFVAPIFKGGQPERGGWRWHKWGIYIGDTPPEYEYLYDEDRHDFVVLFHVYIVSDANDNGERSTFENALLVGEQLTKTWAAQALVACEQTDDEE